MQQHELRDEIAILAARLIAEDGATYAIAKKKAAQQVLGTTKIRPESLPDNGLIEDHVRAYNQLFLAHSQPERLRKLRLCAVTVMQKFAAMGESSCIPYLTGAVANGTAGAYSVIEIHLFADNNKQIEIELLNQGIDFDVAERQMSHQHMHELLSFTFQGEQIQVVLFDFDDLHKTSAKKVPRASLEAVQKMIEESA